MSGSPLVGRVEADLREAMRSRDKRAVSVLRTTLAAFANAEAPPMAAGGAPTAGIVEHERLELSDDDRRRIVAGEIVDREDTIARYERGGAGVEADELRAELEVLRRYVT